MLVGPMLHFWPRPASGLFSCAKAFVLCGEQPKAVHLPTIWPLTGVLSPNLARETCSKATLSETALKILLPALIFVDLTNKMTTI